MKAAEIVPGIYRVGADIGNRDLFEGIWPLPYGVSLNSYVVKGEQVALIDLVKDWEGAAEELTAQLQSIDVTLQDIDYLILNHMEPDHTGWLKEMHQNNPSLQILCSKKAVPLVKAFYGIEDQVKAVKSGDTLDLGGKQLIFEETPNIHWPETMMTFEPESGILFSCDAFGSFGKVGERVFDDQLTPEDREFVRGETERYYANIVSTFSSFVERGLNKLKDLDVKVVAPSHGVVWRTHPEDIIDDYRRLASYKDGKAEKEITVIWSSMYGNTEQLLNPILNGLESTGIPVHVHRVPQEHVSFVLASAWRSSGIVIGTPTYEYRMFPPMYAVLDILERSHVNNRKVMRFGSYGWSGGAKKQFDQFIETMKWECIGSIEYQGAPNEEQKQQAYNTAKELAEGILHD
ncbi:MAG: FprA family A-type flavoprotein [Spirochaetota bacterium]